MNRQKQTIEAIRFIRKVCLKHVSSPVTGRDREVLGATHNWPSVVRVREGLASRDILVSSRTSDSSGGPGAVRANQGCQVHGVSSDTLVRLASGLDARCVKKQRGWLGCVSEDT